MSVCSDIAQLDGNMSITSDISVKPRNRHIIKNASVDHHLPVVTVSNYRSLFPKIQNAKNDIFERQVDINLCCEVWEKSESKKHKS